MFSVYLSSMLSLTEMFVVVLGDYRMWGRVVERKAEDKENLKNIIKKQMFFLLNKKLGTETKIRMIDVSIPLENFDS
jgi:hypothetical protein